MKRGKEKTPQLYKKQQKKKKRGPKGEKRKSGRGSWTGFAGGFQESKVWTLFWEVVGLLQRKGTIPGNKRGTPQVKRGRDISSVTLPNEK